MSIYKRILVAVDGSEAATLGLKEAIKLAKDQGATLRLLHIVNEVVLGPPLGGVMYMGELLESMRNEARDLLEAAAKAARQEGLEPEQRLVESLGGSASHHIVKEAKEWRANLIVLGTHGRRGVQRLVMGSDAEEVVRTTPVPLLLVRQVA